jgi:hypothetical protein
MTEHPNIADPYADPSASDLRAALERRIGADSEKNHELWWLLDRVISAHGNEQDLTTRLLIGELARHFGWLAPSICLMWDEHVYSIHPDDVGRCCTPS